MSRELFDWFKKRRQSESYKAIQEQWQRINQVVIELKKAIEAVQSGQTQESHKCVQRLSMHERAADAIEAQFYEAIAKSSVLSSKAREDLMRMSRAMDFIADWSKVAARSLDLLVEIKATIPEEILTNLQIMLQHNTQQVDALGGIIHSISETEEEVIPLRQKISELERKNDELYLELMKSLAFWDAKPGVVLLGAEMIKGIENACDYIDETAEKFYVVVMANR